MTAKSGTYPSKLGGEIILFPSESLSKQLNKQYIGWIGLRRVTKVGKLPTKAA